MGSHGVSARSSSVTPSPRSLDGPIITADPLMRQRALSIALALWHQLTAKRTSPAVRGIGQGVILILAVLIFGAAVVLI